MPRQGAARASCAKPARPAVACANIRAVPGSDDSRYVLASELLDAIAKALAAMPDSPQKRQIRAKAETYRRTIDQFRTSRVTAAQRDALDEMVLGLHGKLLEVLRRTSLDLTPGPLRFDAEEDEDLPPSSTTPLARLKLRGGRAGPDKP
jgi:hypothetical protein